MPNYEGWVMSGGNARFTQDDTIWIQPFAVGAPFVWLGDCARLDEGTENLGEISTTARRDPRGGLRRHSILKSMPAEVTDTLVFKRIQYDRKKTELVNCFWNIDQRTMCGGIDADDWNGWDEIIRRCYGNATGRTNPASAFDGENAEQMIQLAWTSLWRTDLYRVAGEIDAGVFTALSVMATDMAACQPARCRDHCDDQEDCIVVAVSEDDAANSYLSVNLAGGDLNSWGAVITLTDFGANDADRVACAGSLLVITSSADASIIVSPDLGTTQLNITTTDMTAHAPYCVDMLDHTRILIGGADGYVYGNFRGGRAAADWETLSPGGATTSNLTEIKIAPSDPMVAYAASSAADVVIKTENGGKTWFAQATTGTGGTGITALEIDPDNADHVIVGTDAGEVFETEDGAESWTEQDELPGLATKANTTVQRIVANGCSEWGLITLNSSDDESFFFRNVDNGASARWYQPTEMEAVAAGKSYNALVCCGNNHFVAGGGETATDDLVALIR